jgi:hypothetical protein
MYFLASTTLSSQYTVSILRHECKPERLPVTLVMTIFPIRTRSFSFCLLVISIFIHGSCHSNTPKQQPRLLLVVLFAYWKAVIPSIVPVVFFSKPHFLQ